MLIDIVIKDYPKEAAELIQIWEAHSSSVNGGLEFMTFANKRPINARGNKRNIGGLDAEAISYLGEGKELIKMSVENYIFLMVKSGVDIDIVSIDEET